VKACLWVVAVLTVASCSTGPDQSEVVEQISNQAIVPVLETAAVDLGHLAEAMGSFCDVPGAGTHQEAKDKWIEADRSWEMAEAVASSGPASMLRTVALVDYEPVSAAGIDELLASETKVDVDYVANRVASSRRGLGAIEYVLFRETDEAAQEGPCALGRSASVVARTAADDLVGAWEVAFDSGPAYVETFTSGMDTQDAIADIVGSIVGVFKQQTLFELGAGLGVTSPEPQAHAIVEGGAGTGAARLEAQLAAIEQALTAGEDVSLLELIRSRSPDVADEIAGRLDSARSTVSSIDEPLSSVLASDPGVLEALLEDLTRLRVLFEADVVSALDITLGFSDTDGDSG